MLNIVLLIIKYSHLFHDVVTCDVDRDVSVLLRLRYHLPYVKGLSEQLRRCLQQQGIRAVFKSETTLRSYLVGPKEAVEPTKQDGVVYRFPCECGQVYIGETLRPMQDQNALTTPDTTRFGTKSRSSLVPTQGQRGDSH